MRSLFEIARMELRAQLRHLLPYTAFLLLFALASTCTMLVGSDLIPPELGVRFPANSPGWIANATLAFTILGMLAISGGIFGQSALRDYDANFIPLLVTSGVSEWHFIGGRLLAAWLVSIAVLSAIPFGLYAALWLPLTDTERLVTLTSHPYLVAFIYQPLYLTIVLGSLVFTVALLTRSILVAYFSVFVIPIAFRFLVRGMTFWLSDPLRTSVRGYLNPLHAPLELAGNPTAAESRNVAPIFIPTEVHLHHVGWIVLILLFVIWLGRWYTFSRTYAPASFRTVLRALAPSGEPAPASSKDVPLQVAGLTVAPSPRQQWRQLLLFEWRSMLIRSPWAWVLWGVILVLLVYGADRPVFFVQAEMGSFLRPLSHIVPLLAFLLTLLLGESLARDRSSGMMPLIHGAPVPSWMFWASKLVAVATVGIGLMLITPLLALVTHRDLALVRGQMGMYVLTVLTVKAPLLVLLLVLVTAAHIILRNKYAGHIVSMGFWMAIFGLLPFVSLAPSMPAKYGPLLVGYLPPAPYTSMNGYGHLLWGVYWYQIHWMLLAMLGILLTIMFWNRGEAMGFRTRWRMARIRWHGRLRGITIGTGVALLISGIFLYRVTGVREREKVVAKSAAVKDSVRKHYKAVQAQYMGAVLAQPTLTTVHGTFDLFPRERRLSARLAVTLVNSGTMPVQRIFLYVPRLWFVALQLPTGRIAQTDTISGAVVHQIALDTPLLPNDSITATYAFDMRRPREIPVTITDDDIDIVHNGSRINIGETLMPGVGLPDSRLIPELSSRGSLFTGGTPQDSLRARLFSIHGTPIHFSATVSTAADQTAILPGVLQRNWLENGRRYFSYASVNPRLAGIILLSGRYAKVQRVVEGVTVDFYYHPSHNRGMAEVQRTTSAALARYTKMWGAQSQSSVAVAEIPGYMPIAFTAWNLISIPDNMGFAPAANGSIERKIRLATTTPAHEIAHLWFGMDVIPAFANGSEFIGESIPDYGALLIAEQLHGRRAVADILEHRAEHYFVESGKDVPLVRVGSNAAPAIVYHRGSAALYRFGKVVGDSQVNQALRQYYHQWKVPQPHPLANDAISLFAHFTPRERTPLIHDLFETVTYWNASLGEAQSWRNADRKYTTRLRIDMRKTRYRNKKEIHVPLDDAVEVMVLGESDDIYATQWVRVTRDTMSVTITTPWKPAAAIVDPHNLLFKDYHGTNRRAVIPADRAR